MISRTNGEVADFIIIGAGSAGCTFHHQIACSNHGSTIILEAGSPPNELPDNINVVHPLTYPKLFRSSLDWNFQTQSQPNLAHRKIAWPRGKGLGGSSLINAMIYLPGSLGDVRALAERWNISPDELASHFPHRIQTALWHHAQSPKIHPLSQAFIETTCTSQSISPSEFLKANHYTVGSFPKSIWHGRRLDAYQAFVAIDAAAKRTRVFSDTLVDKIQFEQGRAVAVNCIQEGKRRQFFARRGIILAAGSIASPMILQRSGIGPAIDLEKLGIRVIQNLPAVGHNLQDHLLLPIIFGSNLGSLPRLPTLSETQQFRWHGTGPLSSNIAEAGWFASFDSQEIPQLQIHFTPTHYLEYPVRDQPTTAFTLGLTLLQPKSRGRISLHSACPLEPPRIDPNYLSADEDLHTLCDGVERCRELTSHSPLSGLKTSELLPGTRKSKGFGLERSIQAWCQTVFHPIGTCSIGDENLGVVDSNFKVHGVEGLYVVDASVFDRIPACNPAAQIMALASLAATRISRL